MTPTARKALRVASEGDLRLPLMAPVPPLPTVSSGDLLSPREHSIDAADLEEEAEYEYEPVFGGAVASSSPGDEVARATSGAFWWARLTGGELDSVRMHDGEVRVLQHPRWAPFGIRRCSCAAVAVLMVVLLAALEVDLWRERRSGAPEALVRFNATFADERFSQMASAAHRREFEESFASELLRAVAPIARRDTVVRIISFRPFPYSPPGNNTEPPAYEEPVGVIMETEVLFNRNMEDLRDLPGELKASEFADELQNGNTDFFSPTFTSLYGDVLIQPTTIRVVIPHTPSPLPPPHSQPTPDPAPAPIPSAVCSKYWVVTWKLRVPAVSAERWEGIEAVVRREVASYLGLDTRSAPAMDRLRGEGVVGEAKRIAGCDGEGGGRKVDADVGTFEFIMDSKKRAKALGGWLLGAVGDGVPCSGGMCVFSGEEEGGEGLLLGGVDNEETRLVLGGEVGDGDEDGKRDDDDEKTRDAKNDDDAGDEDEAGEGVYGLLAGKRAHVSPVVAAVLKSDRALCGAHGGGVYKLKKKHRCIEG